MNTPKKEVLDFAELLLSLETANKNLILAKMNVPKYTGDRTDEDYYEDEQAEYYRIAQKIYDTIFQDKGYNL